MKIAIIGAGIIAKNFAVKAKATGIETHCFAWEKGAEAKNFVDCFYPISIFEKDRILEICRELKIDGVVATTELTVSIAGYIANGLKLNTNSQFVADNVTNKYWVRERASKLHNIYQPRFWYIAPNDEKFPEIEFPLVLKPVTEGGKKGVIISNNSEEFNEALKYARYGDKKGNGVIAEEYLEGGSEFSVEGLSFHGDHRIIQITQKISSGPPHFTELGHNQPARITEEQRSSIVKAVTELLDAVPIENGATHTEIKLIDGKVYLVELNARPGGNHISHPLTELSTGYDYITAIMLVAMDIEPPIPTTDFLKYAGVRFVLPQTAGGLTQLEKLENEECLYYKHIDLNKSAQIHDDGYMIKSNYYIYCSDRYPDFLEADNYAY